MTEFHVDDFVVLGRTVPEESRKYGQRVCMAGYSAGCNQFIRVYPLLVPVGADWNANRFRARHRYAVSLRRNPGDNRPESWRVADEHSPTATPWDAAEEVRKEQVVEWLLKRTTDSIASLNNCRLSLGVLRLDAGEWDGLMVPRSEAAADRMTPGLFDALEGQDIDPAAITHAPYIRFRDRCGDHTLQVREWGAYRLLSDPTYARNPSALWRAPGYRQDKSLLVVVGNMCNYRNNWLVIKTFELECRAVGGPSLLSVLGNAAGEAAD